GVRLTCVSAARLHGLWTPKTPGTHAYGRRGSVPSGFVRHGPYLDRWPEPDPIASPSLCLEHAARCLSAEFAATLVESALTQRLLHPAQVELLTSRLPARIRDRLLPVSGLSESGSETRVARWLRARRVPFRQQVQIDGVGRVDILVGWSWVIEVDSRAHHTSVADYELTVMCNELTHMPRSCHMTVDSPGYFFAVDFLAGFLDFFAGPLARFSAISS